MYFHGVKSTAHPPIIGLLGHSTDSVVKQRCCLRRVPITTLVWGQWPSCRNVHGVAPAVGLRYFAYGQNMQSI